MKRGLSGRSLFCFCISTLVKWNSEERLLHFNSWRNVPPKRAFILFTFQLWWSEIPKSGCYTSTPGEMCLREGFHRLEVTLSWLEGHDSSNLFCWVENFLFCGIWPIRGLYPPKSCASEEDLCCRWWLWLFPCPLAYAFSAILFFFFSSNLFNPRKCASLSGNFVRTSTSFLIGRLFVQTISIY